MALQTRIRGNRILNYCRTKFAMQSRIKLPTANYVQQQNVMLLSSASQIAQSPFYDPDGLPHVAWHVRTHSCASHGIVNAVISHGNTCDRTELGYNAPCNLKSQALHHRDRHERKLEIARGLSIHVGFFRVTCG
jgi:hypothetical protein